MVFPLEAPAAQVALVLPHAGVDGGVAGERRPGGEDLGALVARVGLHVHHGRAFLVRLKGRALLELFSADVAVRVDEVQPFPVLVQRKPGGRDVRAELAQIPARLGRPVSGGDVLPECSRAVKVDAANFAPVVGGDLAPEEQGLLVGVKADAAQLVHGAVSACVRPALSRSADPDVVGDLVPGEVGFAAKTPVVSEVVLPIAVHLDAESVDQRWYRARSKLCRQLPACMLFAKQY